MDPPVRTHRLLATTAAACLVLLAVSCEQVTTSGAAAEPGTRAISLVPVATGLQVPAGFTFSPKGQIWYVEKETGEVRILSQGTGADRLFFTITNVDGQGERGALGIALHPRWPAKPSVYVYVTRTDHGTLVNELLRIRSSHGQGTGYRVLFRWPVSSATNHNGGRILFGPDGKLWIVIGENANPAYSQMKANLRGKVLRIDPDGSVPKDNPFGTRIWSYGHRNSFGMAFDPVTGRLWETENGPSCNDEINLIRKGGNFAWGPNQSCGSLAAPHDTNRDGPTPRLLPKTYFLTTIGITGAAFCHGCGLGSALSDDLLFGDVNTEQIRAVDLDAARTGFDASPRVLLAAGTPIYSMEVSPKGRIYVSGPGGIYRLVPA